MTEAPSIATSVEVDLDPDTAFRVFTEELGCWWLQGPINYYDSAKAYGKRMECFVGGRILEVYDPATGDGLELARITTWEPGVTVGWTSSVDDVRTEVRFTKTDGGTVVRVVATIPDGGADRGGTAWVRTTPLWYPRWAARRDQVPHAPGVPSRLAVAVHYRDPGAAARWLRDVFGFDPVSLVPDAGGATEHRQTWIEFQVGDARVVVLDAPPGASATHPHADVVPWVFVDDLDGHYRRASDGGAVIVEEPWHHGVRAYSAADLEGHRWTFAQASPLMRERAAPAPPT
jgi:uncharacterized glyoxalase superfamily protein PhnB